MSPQTWGQPSRFARKALGIGLVRSLLLRNRVAVEAYTDVITDQILLEEPDTRLFVQQIRRPGLLSYVPRIYRRLVWRRRQSRRKRSRKPWTDRPGVIVTAFGLLACGASLCMVAATFESSPPKYATTPVFATAPAARSSGRQESLLRAPTERVIDSEPRGADVYRGGERIGATPFLYDMPVSTPLGTIQLRRPGYRTVIRFIEADAPRVVTIRMRLR